MAKKKRRNSQTELTEQQKNIVRLREKLNAPDLNAVHPFQKYKIITYVFDVLFPPYALYRIWCKKSPFSKNERIVQTGVCIMVMGTLLTSYLNGGI